MFKRRSSKKIDAGRVAARTAKAGDETQLDWVFGDAEDEPRPAAAWP
jgi:hypothetical protein